MINFSDMKVIGIETSCDETSAAVLEVKNGKIKVLSNVVSSQVKIHSPFGGVVPHLAAREHEKNLGPVFEKALKEAKVKMAEIDFIAVTTGPGLEIALWKGVNFAVSLARRHKKPIIGINHLEGHIYSNWLSFQNLSSLKFKSLKVFPVLNLIVSGGHTQLVLMAGHGKFKIIGETVDDAAGEAFDKVAKMMNLGYPGGPIVSKLAEKGDPKKFSFPRPMISQKNYNFSFSGLKTSVLYLLKDLGKINEKNRADISASFQQAAIDVLISKTIKAAKEFKVKTVLLSGGVSANKLLRNTLEKETKKLKLYYSQPDFEYTGDNAAMVALVGYYKKKSLKFKNLNIRNLKADPNLRIKNWRDLS